MARHSGLTLTVRDPGGPFASAYRSAFYDPFERESGVRVIQVHGGGESVEATRQMIASGCFEWDVSVLSKAVSLALREGGECSLEPLGLDSTVSGLLPPDYCDPYFAGDHVYSNVLAYRTDAFHGRPTPSSWKDLFDVAGTPGRRSLRSYPIDTLEEALLADGVEPARLYPLDVERAFRVLSALKKDVHWWFAGDEQVPLMTERKADMCAISNLRAVHAQKLGAPVGICWNQNIRTVYGWGVLRGNPRLDIARDFVRFVVDARRQAERSMLVAVSPAMPSAVPYLSADRLPDLPDAHRAASIEFDPLYWSRERPAMIRAFDAWLAAK